MGIIKTGGAWCGDYWTVVDGVGIMEMGGGGGGVRIIEMGGAWCGDYRAVVGGVGIMEMGGGWCGDY